VLGAIRKPLTARLLLQAVGLHRPQSVPAPAPVAGGGGGDPWAEALSDGRVLVRVHPRMELASGRLGAIEARAQRVDAPSDDAAGPAARACAIVDAASDPCGPARGEAADAIAELVARAGLAAQRLLSDAGELIDVTLVLPPAALDGERVVERLAELADEAGVELERVCVALTDARGTSPGSSSKLASAPLDLLTRLRVHGFGLGIDGFGSAGATLPQLERLPLTEVKVAAEALARATASARGAEAFAATVQALRDQGLDVVCDGCDSHAEWQQAGCRRAQGTLVGPPLHPADLAAWLESWSGVA
jgi:EAL domain-containing protein (putative c-di-GMP-specific phosphodiesterase class I)